jgi:DNA-directed RNA polymerase
MKQKLVASIEKRLKSDEISPRNPVKFLFNCELGYIIDAAISVVYLYTRKTKGSKKKNILMAETISAIGHNIRNHYKLKQDSSVAAKAGAFLLYSFEEIGLLQVVMGAASNGHGTYVINVIDDDAISALWETVTNIKIEKLPSLVPYEDWTSTKHACGVSMVKTANTGVLSELTTETHPMVFECLNRSQRVGWNINKEILNISSWAFRNKVEAFSDIWELHSDEARQSKIREVKAILSIAKRFIDNTFWHLYYMDFRGRKYVATAYLHEQGTDVAKGLLYRADKKVINQQGFYWLLISIASNWAGDAGREDGLKTDKIPLNARVEWALDNEEILISYAENPKVNTNWMKADSPWQFLAACMEWHKAKEWLLIENFNRFEEGLPETDIYEYESHLECFIDG